MMSIFKGDQLMAVTLDLKGASADDILALRRLIDSSAGLRDAKLVSAPPPEGQMNAGVLDIIQVTLGPGGSGTALAGVLVMWLKTRRKEFSASIESAAGKITVKSRNIDNPDEITANIARIIQIPGT